MKKKKRTKTLITLAVIAFVAIVGVAIYEYTQINSLNESNAALQGTIDANTQTVYVATAYIEKGEVISSANVEMQPICTGLEAYNYISSEDLGTTAVVDIDAGTPVMTSMVTTIEVSNDLRDYEIAAVNLVTTQDVNDVIDVRITFPDGSDFIVLSQKIIRDIDLENCVFSTYLNEEEILRFTCAMVDAYTTTGARLYTTRYIESNIQNSAIPTYPVSEVVKELIATDPNVVTVASETLNTTARINLESRLGMLTEEQLDAVNEGFGLVDTAKSSSLQASLAASSEDYVVEDGMTEDGMTEDGMTEDGMTEDGMTEDEIVDEEDTVDESDNTNEVSDVNEVETTDETIIDETSDTYVE